MSNGQKKARAQRKTIASKSRSVDKSSTLNKGVSKNKRRTIADKTTPRRVSSVVKFRKDVIQFSKCSTPLTSDKAIRSQYLRHVRNFLEKYPIANFDLGLPLENGTSDDSTSGAPGVLNSYKIQITANALQAVKESHWAYMGRLCDHGSKLTQARGRKKTTSGDLKLANDFMACNQTYAH